MLQARHACRTNLTRQRACCAFSASFFQLSLDLILLCSGPHGTRIIQSSWPDERLHHEPVFTIWAIMWGRQLLRALGKHSVRV